MFTRRLVLASFAIMALTSACKPETIKTAPERRGARGEGCLVTNDCKSGLLCIADRCIDEDFALYDRFDVRLASRPIGPRAWHHCRDDQSLGSLVRTNR